MEIVVKSNHCELTERFRSYATEKITKLEKLAAKAIRVEVQLSKEKNPRQHDQAFRVELTLRTKGPLVRAEAAAEEELPAFDKSLNKLLAQLRKAADRRRVHHGNRRPTSVAEATAGITADPDLETEPSEDLTHQQVGGLAVAGEGPLVVREKVHVAAPMDLAQALWEMELVGHDFYLFVDSGTSRPAVVYRRKGYDYGVIQLQLDASASRVPVVDQEGVVPE